MFNGLWNFKSLKRVELNLEFYYWNFNTNCSGAIYHLTVKNMPFFYRETLSEISREFPNLAYFRVNNALMNNAMSDEDVPWNFRPEDLPKKIEDTFKDVAKVEIQLHFRTWIDGLIDIVVDIMNFLRCLFKNVS